jgi:hypothetical protein
MYLMIDIVDGGVRCGGVAVGFASAFERALEQVKIRYSFGGR